VENWAEIRRLHRAEGLPIKAIVRQTGVSRSAVRRASSTVYRTVLQTTLRGSFSADVDSGTSLPPGRVDDGLVAPPDLHAVALDLASYYCEEKASDGRDRTYGGARHPL